MNEDEAGVSEPDESEEVLDRLREAAREAARAGYYGDYLQVVVSVAVSDIVPANPDDDARRRER